MHLSHRLNSIGHATSVSRHAKIYVKSSVRIGSNCSINDFVHIWGAGGVQIGDDCLIASHCVITSQSHDPSALRRDQRYRETSVNGPIVIGNNVWICSGAIILPNVTIGDGAIVAAGAVVNCDVAAGSMVGGVPAKLIRHLI